VERVLRDSWQATNRAAEAAGFGDLLGPPAAPPLPVSVRGVQLYYIDAIETFEYFIIMDSVDNMKIFDALVDEVVDLFHTMGKLRWKSTVSAWMNLHLTLPQFKMLVVLAKCEASDIGGVAEQLCIAESTASYLVDRLVQARLVERADDPEDRRRAIVMLSAEGRTLLDSLIGPQDWLNEVLKGMGSDDLAALKQGFSAAVAVLETKQSRNGGGAICRT
jgi:DNA-binding MarR family transcriptional regulator